MAVNRSGSLTGERDRWAIIWNKLDSNYLGKPLANQWFASVCLLIFAVLSSFDSSPVVVLLSTDKLPISPISFGDSPRSWS